MIATVIAWADKGKSDLAASIVPETVKKTREPRKKILELSRQYVKS